MMGTMVRVMRFQSSVSLIGITGWMFRSQTLRFSGPVLKLKLFWNGTLMRSATGVLRLLRQVGVALFVPACWRRALLRAQWVREERAEREADDVPGHGTPHAGPCAAVCCLRSMSMPLASRPNPAERSR